MSSCLMVSSPNESSLVGLMLDDFNTPRLLVAKNATPANAATPTIILTIVDPLLLTPPAVIRPDPDDPISASVFEETSRLVSSCRYDNAMITLSLVPVDSKDVFQARCVRACVPVCARRVR
jgi:hypothetical protein